MKDKINIRGMVTVQVFDQNGKLKRRSPGPLRRLFCLPGRLMVYCNHNIVTREGDALIADALLAVPTRAKVSSENGFIQVGIGWTGNSTKSNTRCNTPSGDMRALDANYPSILTSWGNQGDTTICYKATFTAGALNANGINEACLLNGNTITANCLAYAQITPVINITSSDTLQIQWEITILGQ